jgi:hypothetical protein
MDLTGTYKPVIVCEAMGGWYAAGQDRLKNSLIHHGYAGDFLFYRNEYPPYSPTHEENPYAFKIYGIREAIRLGYKTIIQIDCSFWSIRNPMPLFDIIIDKGVFAFRSGYNCAETCPDNLLADVGITRDEAEQIPETATGIVGLHMDNPDAKKVFEYWEDFCDRGLFINNRVHDLADSSDPRFKHGRQDQSAFSMALYKAGVNILYEDYVAYYNHGNPGYSPERCYFFIGGL